MENTSIEIREGREFTVVRLPEVVPVRARTFVKMKGTNRDFTKSGRAQVRQQSDFSYDRSYRKTRPQRQGTNMRLLAKPDARVARPTARSVEVTP